MIFSKDQSLNNTCNNPKLMSLKRANIIVSGNVQMAGFRTFVKNIADSLDVKGYADNLSDGRVIIVCEGKEEKINELVTSIKTQSSGFSQIDDLQIEYGEYRGEFHSFERRGDDVPVKATLDDLLKVMVSFENKAEKMVAVLGQMNGTLQNMNGTLEIIRENTEKTLRKQDQMLGMQSQMLGMQKITHAKQDLLQHTVENTQVETRRGFADVKEEVHSMRNEFKEFFSEEVKELRVEIADLKQAITRIETRIAVLS